MKFLVCALLPILLADLCFGQQPKGTIRSAAGGASPGRRGSSSIGGELLPYGGWDDGIIDPGFIGSWQTSQPGLGWQLPIPIPSWQEQVPIGGWQDQLPIGAWQGGIAPLPIWAWQGGIAPSPIGAWQGGIAPSPIGAWQGGIAPLPLPLQTGIGEAGQFRQSTFT